MKQKYWAEFVANKNNIKELSPHVFEINSFTRKSDKMLVLITGLSGAGKDSVMESMIGANGLFERVKTSTTREKREEEIKNDPYNRLTVEEFWNQVKMGSVLEHVEYDGHFYYSDGTEILKIFDKGKIPVLRVDPTGAKAIMETCVTALNIGPIDILYLFVLPSQLADIDSRLKQRGEDEDFVAGRVLKNKSDIKMIGDANWVVENSEGELKQVGKELLEIIEKL